MSTTEYVTIVPSTDKSVLFSEVMRTIKSVTIVPSTYISVLFAEAMSTTKYVITSEKYIYHCILE